MLYALVPRTLAAKNYRGALFRTGEIPQHGSSRGGLLRRTTKSEGILTAARKATRYVIRRGYEHEGGGPGCSPLDTESHRIDRGSARHPGGRAIHPCAEEAAQDSTERIRLAGLGGRVPAPAAAPVGRRLTDVIRNADH